MKKNELRIAYPSVSSLDELSKEYRTWVSKAVEATTISYAPFSRSFVESAFLLKNGQGLAFDSMADFLSFGFTFE